MANLQEVMRRYELLPIPMPGSDRALRLRSEVRWIEARVPRAPDIDADQVAQLRELILEAWLFRDVDYGQWGLHVLTPQAARDALVREARARPGDTCTSTTQSSESSLETPICWWSIGQGE